MRPRGEAREVRILTSVCRLSIYSNVRRVDLEVKKVHDIVREFFERKLDTEHSGTTETATPDNLPNLKYGYDYHSLANTATP